MKALCRLGVRKYTTMEIPVPEITSDEEILVRMKCCTDNVFLDLQTDNDSGDPYALLKKMDPVGYIGSGIVERVGSGASANFRVGDKVTAFYRAHCGKCDACRSGMERMCADMSLTTGTMAEYIVWKEIQVQRLPSNVDFDLACFTVPVMRVLRVLDAGEIKAGDSVVINGSNMYSLITLKVLKMVGVGHITVLSNAEIIRKRAISLGADSVFEPSNIRLSSVLAELPYPEKGFQALIDFECDSALLRRLISLLGDAGHIVIPVTKSNAVLSLPIGAMYIGEYDIKFIKDDIHYMSRALQILPALHLEEMISRKLTLEESPVLYTSEFYRDNIMGVVYL